MVCRDDGLPLCWFFSCFRWARWWPQILTVRTNRTPANLASVPWFPSLGVPSFPRSHRRPPRCTLGVTLWTPFSGSTCRRDLTDWPSFNSIALTGTSNARCWMPRNPRSWTISMVLRWWCVFSQTRFTSSQRTLPSAGLARTSQHGGTTRG